MIQSYEIVSIILDEILKGTNSTDRHTGSKALIQQFINSKGSISRLIRNQEKITSSNKNSTSSRRSTSPNDEAKANKRTRPSGNADIREWDLPKFQEEKDKDKEKSPQESNITEEPKGNEINEKFHLIRSSFVNISNYE